MCECRSERTVASDIALFRISETKNVSEPILPAQAAARPRLYPL